MTDQPRRIPTNDEYQEWMLTRPPCVQKLAAEFPMGPTFETPEGETLYLVGWTEGDSLIVSPLDPYVDYDAAYAVRVHVCAGHYREARMTPLEHIRHIESLQQARR